MGDDDGGASVSLAALVVSFGFGLPLVVVGTHGAVVQDQQIAGAETTEATVTSVTSNVEVESAAANGSPSLAGDRARRPALAGSTARDQAGGAAGVVAASQNQFVFEVTYRYAVDGRTYTSSAPYPIQVRETLPAAVARALGLGSSGTTVVTSDIDTAQEYADRFRVNETIPVYYEPGDPGDSFLFEHYSTAPYAVVVLGLAFLTPAVVGALRLLAHRLVGDAGGRSPVRFAVGAGLFVSPVLHFLVVSGSPVRTGVFLFLSVPLAGPLATLLYAVQILDAG